MFNDNQKKRRLPFAKQHDGLNGTLARNIDFFSALCSENQLMLTSHTRMHYLLFIKTFRGRKKRQSQMVKAAKRGKLLSDT